MSTELPENRHVIVCGYSRAGTTMFYNMLRYALPDYTFFESERNAMGVRGPGRICSKRPMDVLETLKHRIFIKHPVYLILVRDMRAILCSRHKSVPDDYFIGWDHQYHVRKTGKHSFTKPGIIPLHKRIVKLAAKPNAHIVRYEDLLTDPDGQQDRLCPIFGVASDPARRFSDFHKAEIPESLQRALNGVRPLDTTRMESWKKPEHRQRVIDQFTRCPQLFDLLQWYGYEADNSWFDNFRDAA